MNRYTVNPDEIYDQSVYGETPDDFLERIRHRDIAHYTVQIIPSGDWAEIKIFPEWKKRSFVPKKGEKSPEAKQRQNHKDAVNKLTRILNHHFKPYEDAQHNPRVNNYRVDLEPTFGEIKTVDISTITDEHGDPLPVTDKTYRLTYVEGQGYNNYWRGQPVLLSSMIENMEYTENTTQLNYTTRNVDWDASRHGQSVNLDTILIVPSGWLTYEAGELIWGAIVNPSIDASTVTITGGAHNPVQSMTVDIYTREAKLYSDTDYSVPIGTYDLDKILVFYGDSPYPYNYKLNLDVDFEFQEVITDRVYLDPNNGVSLKDGE